jgi:putative ABC transport system permease protein
VLDYLDFRDRNEILTGRPPGADGTVRQRTRELGIRMSAGAEQRDILRLILGQGLALSIIGLLGGLVAALAITRFTASLLYGVSATDPGTFLSIALLLMCVALLACYFPARRGN